MIGAVRKPSCIASAGVLMVLAGCASTSPSARMTAGLGAAPGAKPAPAPIHPPRKVSSQQPTRIVGGPILFRAPDPDSAAAGAKQIMGFAYVLVFKLNRDPFVPGDGENNNQARGDVSFAGRAASGDAGARKSSGRHCFVTYYSGSEINSDPGFGQLKALTTGQPVRVEMRPKAAQPTGRTFRFDVPLLEAASRDMTDKASLRQLRLIGCGPPSL